LQLIALTKYLQSVGIFADVIGFYAAAFTMIMRFDNYSRVYIAARYVHSKHEEVKKVWKCGGVVNTALRALEFRRCVRKLHCRTPSDPFYRFSSVVGVCVRNFDRKLYLTRQRQRTRNEFLMNKKAE